MAETEINWLVSEQYAYFNLRKHFWRKVLRIGTQASKHKQVEVSRSCMKHFIKAEKVLLAVSRNELLTVIKHMEL